MTNRTGRKVVEEALGDAVTDTLRGPALGESIVQAIDRFVFNDIETDHEALDLFAFVQSESTRALLASTFRGARWLQKTGLVLARPAAHPAHAAQVRSQFIEYGAIAETALRAMLEQNRGEPPPEDFGPLIARCRSAGILSKPGEAAAEELRLMRNNVHLFLVHPSSAPRAEKDGRIAYKALSTVLNDCRRRAKLAPWRFGRHEIASARAAGPSVDGGVNPEPVVAGSSAAD